MNIQDISEADLTTLKAEGYTESDLGMLADTEVKALLGSSGGSDSDPDRNDGDGDEDPHERAEREQAEAAAAAAAEAAAAAGNVSTPGGAPTETKGFVVPTYTANVPEDMAEQIAAAKGKEREAFKQLMDGIIDADEYQKRRDEAEAQIDALKTKALTSSILEDVNRQNAEQQAEAEWARAQQTSFAAFKAEGLDYKHPERPALLAAFNYHLKALAGDAKNEKRDGVWFLSEAHRLTKADLGVTTVAKKGATTTPRGVDPADIPPTLRSVPAAATNAANTDEFAHMRGLEGVALERAHAALTEQQRDRYMAE